MIAKVPEKRNDGRSSFASLGRYIAGEKLDRETGEIVRSAEDIHLDTNCLSARTASAEMRAVADMNSRVKDPVYHCILSWREGEKPTNDQVREAAMAAMKSVGMEGHQYVLAVHRDSDNTHVHMMVNRVNPDTYRAVYPKQDFLKLDRCMRETELQQGWEHDNGPHRVTDDGKIERTPREPAAPPLPTKARDMEAATGCESLLTYAQSAAPDLVAALGKGSWQDLHAALRQHGLEIREAGQGYRIHDLANPDTPPVKASDVAGELGGGKLKKRLGEFEKPLRVVAAEKPAKTYNPYREKQRDARDERREARAAARLALRQQYDKAKAEHRAMAGSEKAARLEANKVALRSLSARARSDRARIKASGLPPQERQARLSILAMQTVQERERIKAAGKPARMQSYKNWCAERAAAGDAAAIAQLRAWAYQDSRRRATAQQAEREAMERGAILAGEIDTPVRPRVGDGISWSVDRRSGDVTYVIDGLDALRDTGRLVAVLQPADAKSIETGLKLAAQKFGPELTLSGPAEFQRRVVEIAVEKRLGVRFADPAAEAYRVQLDQARQVNHLNQENGNGSQSSGFEGQERAGERGSGQEKAADISSTGAERVRPVSIGDVVRGGFTDADKAGGVLQRPQKGDLGRGR